MPIFDAEFLAVRTRTTVRLRALRIEMGDENYSARTLLEMTFLIFEFYSLRRKGYVSDAIWSIWESDITRLLNTASFQRDWAKINERFDTHPHFVAWIRERQGVKSTRMN